MVKKTLFKTASSIAVEGTIKFNSKLSKHVWGFIAFERSEGLWIEG